MTVQILLVFLLMNLIQIQCDTAQLTMLSTWTSPVSSSITSNQPSGTSGLSSASTYATSPTAQLSSMYSSPYITSPTTPFSSPYITSPTTPVSSPYITSPTTPVSSPYITSPTTPISSPYVTSPTTPVSSPYVTSPTTPVSSPYVTSPTIQSSPLSTMNPSTYVTSSNVQTSFTTVTTQPKNITYDLIYQFTVSSSVGLMTGNFTNAIVLSSVQTMVRSAFTLPNFIITVIRVEIRSSLTKSISTYQMFTENLFQTSDNSCPATCIQNAASKSPPPQTFQLIASDGTFATEFAQSAPIYVSVNPPTPPTTMATTYSTGDSPPGLPGRLGMGLGISFIAVLLIAEVIILYRKFGMNTPNRQSQYEMSSYNN